MADFQFQFVNPRADARGSPDQFVMADFND